MSTTNIYRVDFVVKKPGAGGAGAADAYRRSPRSAVVQAASIHPHDLLVPLSNNVSLSSGEVIELLHAHQLAEGSEGSPVWQ